MHIPNLRSLRVIKLPPSAVLALLYLTLIIIGTILLKLPISNTQPLAWRDALFTATSAVTVTGLGVVDTGSQFTIWGQAIILILLELGGLGIMTFAVLVLSMLGFQIGTAQHAFLREDLNQTSVSTLLKLVWIIFKVVFICQLIGAIILSFVFIPELGSLKGIWFAIFHSISAFTNGGFALYSNSMMPFVGNPIINFTIPVLVIIGGIGYSVITDIWTKRRWHQFTLHTKLMLVGTATLLLVSIALFAALEWSNPKTLGALSTSEKWSASWFQMVISRSGGFNSIDLAGMHDSTILMFIMLMLIGGGSTSMAGGLKVTTFIVLLLSAVAFFKRQRWIHVFGRSISQEHVQKVLALTVTTLTLLMLAVFLLAIDSDGQILAVFFEATSALATVGASLGITASLNDFERSIIMILMFIGRVGPLSLGIFLAMNSAPRVRYPNGQIYFG